jgi:hypothetical protein
MNKIVAILVAGCLLVVLAFCVGAAPAESEDLSGQIKTLKKELSSLQEHVQRLEKRLEKAELIISRLWPGQDDAMCVTPPMLCPRTPLPKGWQKRQFNGITYYLVPVDEDGQIPTPLTK